jgi:hypothetical protein
MKDNMKWLQLHGLSKKGKAKDLKERVARAMKEGEPPIPPPVGGSPEQVFSIHVE